MLSQERYFYLDLQGECAPPTALEAAQLRAQGVIPAFLLDANVCHDLMRIGDGKVALADAPRAHHLLADAELAGVDVLAAPGVGELCLDNASFDLDLDCFGARGAAVMRALHLDLAQVQAPSSPSRRPIQTDLVRDSALAFEPLFYLFYAHLLKIRLVARRGLAAAHAYDNLAEYLQWANDELKNVSGLPMQVALAVFGGESRVYPLLRLQKQNVDEIGATRGAAWDLVHVMFSQHGSVSPVDGQRHKMIFVTSDKAIFEVASRYVVAGLLRGTPLGDLPLGGVAADAPHLASIQPRLQKLMMTIRVGQIKRMISGYAPGVDEYKAAARRLESELTR